MGARCCLHRAPCASIFSDLKTNLEIHTRSDVCGSVCAAHIDSLELVLFDMACGMILVLSFLLTQGGLLYWREGLANVHRTTVSKMPANSVLFPHTLFPHLPEYLACVHV